MTPTVTGVAWLVSCCTDSPCAPLMPDEVTGAPGAKISVRVTWFTVGCSRCENGVTCPARPENASAPLLTWKSCRAWPARTNSGYR